jgi:hypothetical protein
MFFFSDEEDELLSFMTGRVGGFSARPLSFAATRHQVFSLQK